MVTDKDTELVQKSRVKYWFLLYPVNCIQPLYYGTTRPLSSQAQAREKKRKYQGKRK